MLASLRLDAFVGGDDQQNNVYSTDAGEHVADETFMSRDIDEAEADRSAARVLKFHVREADVDSDSAALLFFQPVCVNASESFDQRGLTMVDMTGGAHD